MYKINLVPARLIIMHSLQKYRRICQWPSGPLQAVAQEFCISLTVTSINSLVKAGCLTIKISLQAVVLLFNASRPTNILHGGPGYIWFWRILWGSGPAGNISNFGTFFCRTKCSDANVCTAAESYLRATAVFTLFLNKTFTLLFWTSQWSHIYLVRNIGAVPYMARQLLKTFPPPPYLKKIKNKGPVLTLRCIYKFYLTLPNLSKVSESGRK